MSTLVKIRISDIAKDLGVSNKVIMGILTEHNLPPKSPAKVLDSNELNIVFNAITAKNQVADLEAALKKTSAVSAAAPAAEAKSPEQPASDKPVAEKPAAEKPVADKPRQPAPQTANNNSRPAPATEKKPEQAAKQPANQQRKPERRYVDTRGSSVDMSKYDEKLDRLAGDKEVNSDNVGKQKIKKSKFIL